MITGINNSWNLTFKTPSKESNTFFLEVVNIHNKVMWHTCMMSPGRCSAWRPAGSFQEAGLQRPGGLDDFQNPDRSVILLFLFGAVCASQRWPEELVPWTGFKSGSPSRCGGFHIKSPLARGAKPRPGSSCVYSRPGGGVRVHREEHAAEALIEIKSLAARQTPCGNIDRHQFRCTIRVSTKHSFV